MIELPEKFEFLREQIEKTFRHTIELKFVDIQTKPWESKLGGCPYLKDKSDYPLDREGDPMMFLAQINFAEMPEMENFPQKGILQFYVVNDESYGYDEPCKVIYIEDYITDETKILSENPYQNEIQENLPFEKNTKIIFNSTYMPITQYENELDSLINNINDEDEDEFYDLLYGAGSRIGGYPCFVQNPVPCYDNGEKDILLLQLDEDSVADIMFGDSGNCQFFISKKDLINKDFSDVVYDWACC